MTELFSLSEAFVWVNSPEAWMGLFTLIILEIILGIDNVIFLSIIVDKLPPEQQEKARRIGLTLAMVMRLILLMCISWVMSLTTNIFGEISWKDLILILGGLFLVVKSANEIFSTVEGVGHNHSTGTQKAVATMGAVLVQICIVDVIFSLDSVITAVGMIDHISIMMIAVVVSIGIMILAAKSIGEFVNKHPSMKILALAFLIMIGVVLMAEGFEYHLPKNFIYGTMAVCIIVELLNMRLRKKTSQNYSNVEKCKACGQALPMKEESVNVVEATTTK